MLYKTAFHQASGRHRLVFGKALSRERLHRAAHGLVQLEHLQKQDRRGPDLRAGGMHERKRTCRGGLYVCQPRRQLAQLLKRRGRKASGRPRDLCGRDTETRRKNKRAGAESRNILLQRNGNVRGSSRQPSPRKNRRKNLCRMGDRILQIRFLS